MADGGFLVKMNDKEFCRCYSITLDYDEWQYTVNDSKPQPIPDGTETISVEVEESYG